MRVTSLLQDLTSHRLLVVGGVVRWSVAAPALTRCLSPTATRYCSLIGHCPNPDMPPIVDNQGVLFVGRPLRLPWHVARCLRPRSVVRRSATVSALALGSDQWKNISFCTGDSCRVKVPCTPNSATSLASILYVDGYMIMGLKTLDCQFPAPFCTTETINRQPPISTSPATTGLAIAFSSDDATRRLLPGGDGESTPQRGRSRSSSLHRGRGGEGRRGADRVAEVAPLQRERVRGVRCEGELGVPGRQLRLGEQGGGAPHGRRRQTAPYHSEKGIPITLRRTDDTLSLIVNQLPTYLLFLMQKLSIKDQWLIYEGEEAANPRFAVKRHVSLLHHRALAHVTPCVSGAKPCHAYEIEGSYLQRCCAVVDDKRQQLMEIKRKEPAKGITFGLDVFRLIVQPGFDTSFAMAIVMLLEQMFGS
ncbi:hypothetical protein B296_00013628 [Ensete ventricosum]|uniref:Tubby C-terminal domain-containing protein n=1 Tax=Ensete ventricosum TaxID=4639 RepID=A0A427B879_ENSVE|nr:hypothetical protein B296_00013628 [Ensete ventricosum]